ncbi:MAG TPA: 2OG-Fe(II) oxygenase family protein [Ilumatobacteraceae bacterium]
MTIATIDCHDPEAPRRFTESLIDTGFAILVDHAVPYPAVLEMRDAWAAFFADDTKYGFLPSAGNQDGYHPMSMAEQAVGAKAADLKEFFHWYPWARQPPGVSAATGRFFTAAYDLAKTLLDWLDQELATRIDRPLPRSLTSMLVGSRRTLLRVAHYPPLTAAPPPGSMRAAPHEDINLLTVLPAADSPGLQVLGRDGAWTDVADDAGTITINAGDMLQLVTGGAVRSATHRVANPTGPAARTSRLSTPLFVQPADDVELAPGTTAFAFQAERLRAIRGIELGPLTRD